MPANKNFDIPDLGSCELDSPFLDLHYPDGRTFNFTSDSERILVDHSVASLKEARSGVEDLPSFECAGARRKIYFNSAETTVGIVTCGGLCPGINNVIRDTVLSCLLGYGVKKILGFKYGYRGLAQGSYIELTPERVSEIHEMGGTILGTSRGLQDPAAVVDTLEKLGVDVLFTVGGDGTMKGSIKICTEIKRRGLKIAVVGIPKTIDNDFKFMDRSFGYYTAYSKALEAIDAAHREAQAAPKGLGLVKLMGRYSGFITCSATLASNQVNIALIPEIPFKLEGPNGLLAALKKRFESRNHAVVVVAEGAGQNIVEGPRPEPDSSGNPGLVDIGSFLKKRIKGHFKSAGVELTLKYIDPSYIIRSLRACPADSVLCTKLAINGVHAAMCGKTETVVGVWHDTFVHVPMRQAISEINKVDPAGPLWLSVLGTTGQPLAFS
jgi:6-phosphofructokinase 1